MLCRNANKQIQFLLLQTNEQRGQFWQNITGSVEAGEDYLEAAMREAVEETGVKNENIVDLRDIGMGFEFQDRWGEQAKEKVFVLECGEVFTPVLDPKEHRDFKWTPREELSRASVKYESNWHALEKAMESL